MRQRHWINRTQGGETAILTTTALDFVHIFRNEDIRSLMTASLIDDLAYYGCVTHGFVVMPHHFHVLATLPLDLTATMLMQRIKSNSEKRIHPLLDLAQEREFDQQRGLNRHKFWQRSFRGYTVRGERSFLTRLAYIHRNPIKGEMVAGASDYLWSSAWAYDLGLLIDEYALDLDRVLPTFAPHGLPWQRKKRRDN